MSLETIKEDLTINKEIDSGCVGRAREEGDGRGERQVKGGVGIPGDNPGRPDLQQGAGGGVASS